MTAKKHVKIHDYERWDVDGVIFYCPDESFAEQKIASLENKIESYKAISRAMFGKSHQEYNRRVYEEAEQYCINRHGKTLVDYRMTEPDPDASHIFEIAKYIVSRLGPVPT
jgi:hypothetical protein